jgi:hypothetical protein
MIASNRFAQCVTLLFKNFGYGGHVPLATQDRNLTLMLVNPKGEPNDGN